MKRPWQCVLVCCLLATPAAAFHDEEVRTPEFSADNFTTTQSAVSDRIMGHKNTLASPETPRKLKCVCTNCPSNECETDGLCYITVTRETSGERQTYREQACLNKSKQFPPGISYKCQGGYFNKIYPELREEIYCCRDDYCNSQHVLAKGGLTTTHSTQGPPQRLEPGEKGGEGKASTSPASPPSNRLDCHH